MTDLKRLLFMLAALLLAVSALSPPCADAGASFPVFDALLYKNKPDLAQYGLSPLRMVYAQEIWAGAESRDNPNTAKIAEVAGKIVPGSLVCVDIEHWSVTGRTSAVKESIAKYATVMSVMKWNSPTVKAGFYGVLPIRDYWRAIGSKGKKGFDEWRRQNLKIRQLADSVDVVFPSLYTLYADQSGWEEYAIRNLQEARKYGKPVYAFLWPQYHDMNKQLKGQYIPVDFWRLQLETCRKYADGIVIWGGYQQQWDENAPWWVETRKFMEGT